MFERFTDRARLSVVLASDEAKGFRHEYVGPEHLLLGLAHEGQGVAGQVLMSLGISEDMVRQQIADLSGYGQHEQSGILPFTVHAKKALGLALRESLQLGHDYIGTEHLLLGLLDDSGSLATQMIISSGSSLNEVRERVVRMLGTPASCSAEPSREEPAPETPEEKSLFERALTITMLTPDIAKVADSLDTRTIEDWMGERRSQIWKSAEQQRARTRSASAELKAITDIVMPKAEATARRDHPELLRLQDEATLKEEQIAEATARAVALEGALCKIRDRGLTTDEARQADQVTGEMRETIRECDAWVERLRVARRQPASGNSSQKPEDPETNHKSAVTSRLSKLRGLASRSPHSPAAQYKEISELLLGMRKVTNEVRVERRRADLQLSRAALDTAKRDDDFRSAKDLLEGASEALVSALRDAMVPEVRIYIGQMC